MLRIGKTNQPTSLRMPEMTTIPTVEDLHFLLSKAQRNWRATVELPFKTPDATFMVVVKCEMGTGTPNWALYRADLPGYPVAWNHLSTDMLLIHNLIGLECAAAASRKTVFGAVAEQPAPSIAEEMPAPVRTETLEEPAGPNDSTVIEAEEGSEKLEECRGEKPQSVVDSSIVESVERNLSRAESGIFSYMAFLYFLEHEFVRFQRGGLPFSIVVFELSMKVGDAMEPVPMPAAREACDRIRKMKRTLDMVAHFEALEFAFLLPHTEPAGAAVFCSRVEKLIREGALPGVDNSALVTAYGIAGIPEDCSSPDKLLLAASEARKHALTAGKTTVCYKDIED